VPQQLSADGALTGREYLSLFARLFDVPRRERVTRVDEALESMGLGDAADRLASTYSGGMIRRLELAQALISRPHLLVLEEPTIGLDPIGRDSVWERSSRARRSRRVRALAQGVVVIVLSLLLGVDLRLAPWRVAGALLVVVLGSAFFSTLSMTLAGLVLSRERLMGIEQAITMPLFFASNALYPVGLMPAWLRVFSRCNPLSYEVNARRGLLLGLHTNLLLDFGVLVGSVIVGVTAAGAVLPRLVR
jgi:ABC-2 type transporter/ABC transporter